MFNNKKEVNEVEKQSASTNLLSKGALIRGDYSSKGSLRLEGKIEGNVRCEAKIVLGETGRVVGDVHGQNVEIYGRVEGNLMVQATLTIRSTAQIEGDIQTEKMIVESGAVFNGQCKMGSAKTRLGSPHNVLSKTETLAT